MLDWFRYSLILDEYDAKSSGVSVAPVVLGVYGHSKRPHA